MEQTLTKGSLKGLRKGQGSFQKEPSGLRVRQEGRQPEEQTKAREARQFQGNPPLRQRHGRPHRGAVIGRCPPLSSPHAWRLVGWGGAACPEKPVFCV